MASRSQATSSDTATTTRTRTRKSTTAKAATQETAATSVPEEMRRQWVAEAAYFIAERRGFAAGSSEADWLQAEQDIGHLLESPRH